MAVPMMLKTELTGLSNSVVTATQLRAEIAKSSVNAPSTPAQEKLYSRFQQAIDQTNEIARRYSTLPDTTPGPSSQPPIPVPGTPFPGTIPQHQGSHAEPTTASVQADIERTINRLTDIDRNTHSSVQSILSSVRSQYIYSGGANQASKDAAFRNTVPQLLGVLKGREEASSKPYA